MDIEPFGDNFQVQCGNQDNMFWSGVAAGGFSSGCRHMSAHSILKKCIRYHELRTPPVKDVFRILVYVGIVIPLECSRVVEPLSGMYCHGNSSGEKQQCPERYL